MRNLVTQHTFQTIRQEMYLGMMKWIIMQCTQRCIDYSAIIGTVFYAKLRFKHQNVLVNLKIHSYIV